jgi:hypothetical protein
MIATNKLRFVERVHPYMAHQIVCILQQWWDNPYDFGDDPDVPRLKGEWRDIPIEQEKNT